MLKHVISSGKPEVLTAVIMKSTNQHAETLSSVQHQLTSTKVHSFTSQKIVFFTYFHYLNPTIKDEINATVSNNSCTNFQHCTNKQIGA
jgi:hypothetical protein